MRRGFTMIEMIFVIVIVGILASVAIPRMSATRDDAIDSRDCKNLAVCITDLVAEYTAKQTVTKTASKACSKVSSSSKNSISINVDMTNKDITVTGAPSMCNDLNRVFRFGGTRVNLN